nr:probable inactive DNA (cytosine-5)-methyltransferase DRM3 isoform X3 [Tanacetum cinerariifolium]
DPDEECCDVMDDKKASLLMMNFTIEELFYLFVLSWLEARGFTIP